MSLAIGMDAFSLAVGVGLHGINRRRALQLSASIGACHTAMTLAGLYTGLLLQGLLGTLAHTMGALLLCGLGLFMLYSSIFGTESHVSVGPGGLAVALFSAGVSVDALSVGFSLGLHSTAYGLTSAAAFGVFGGGMSLLGLALGKRANRWVGMYGELAGALILLGYGLHFWLS